MKNQALFSFKDKSKKLKFRLLQFLFGALKVGSWSLEGIIILLIYFLNCRKALFAKKQASVSKKA